MIQTCITYRDDNCLVTLDANSVISPCDSPECTCICINGAELQGTVSQYMYMYICYVYIIHRGLITYQHM